MDTTAAWGYHSVDAPLWDSLGLNYLGPTIVALEGTLISVDWVNGLPSTHLLDVDTTPHGASESLEGRVRVQPHVHGGLTVASSDGNPFANNAFLEAETYTYRNAQDPANIWYHDHALGITRLNVFAGLAGFYIIRDDQDTGAVGNPLDLPAYPYEFPVAIQDKTFDINGNLYYPAIPGDPLAGPRNPTVPVVPGVDAFGTIQPIPRFTHQPHGCGRVRWRRDDRQWGGLADIKC